MAGYTRGRRPSGYGQQKKSPQGANRRIENPFEKLAAQPGYHYFDLNFIVRNLTFMSSDCAKAREMIQKKEIECDFIDVGYLTSRGNSMGLLATAYYTEGEYPYDVSLQVDKDSVLHLECMAGGCPFYYGSYYGGSKTLCAHLIALFFLVEDYIIVNNPGDATSDAAGVILERYRTLRANTAMLGTVGDRRLNLKIEPRLENTETGLALSFRTGIDKLFVVKNLTDFVRQVDSGETVTFGKNTNISFGLCQMDEKSQALYDFLRAAVLDRQDKQKRLDMKQSYYYDSVNIEVKSNIDLSGARLDEFYHMMSCEGAQDVLTEKSLQVSQTDKSSYSAQMDTNSRSAQMGKRDSETSAAQGYAFEYVDKTEKRSPKKMLVCKDGMMKPDLIINENKDARDVFQGVLVTGLLPTAQEGAEAYYMVDEENACLLRIKKEKMKGILPLYEMANYDNYVSFTVGRKNLSEFYYSVLPMLKKYCQVTEIHADEVEPYLPEEVVFRFYLDIEGEDITCKAQALYGDKAESIMDAVDEQKRMHGDLTRDFMREEEALYHVLRYFMEVNQEEDCFYCERTEEAVYNLLNQGVEELMEIGEVHSTDRFQRLRIRRAPKVTVGVSVQSGIMNLSVSSDDLTQEEMLEILSQYKRKKRFFRLKSGDFIDLEEESLEALGELMDSMQVSPREFVKGKMQLPAYRALYLDRMLEESSGIYSRRDNHFRKLVKEFKTVNDSDFEVPESLQDTLRNYQITGYKWLRTLAAYGFGGILADDMGLGKTVQVIAVMLALKEEADNIAAAHNAGQVTAETAADSFVKRKEGQIASDVTALEDKNGLTSASEISSKNLAEAGVNESKINTWLVVCPASLVYNWQDELRRFAPSLSVCLIVGTLKEREEKLRHYNEYDVLVTSYDLLKRDIDHYEDCTFKGQILDEAQFIKNHTTAAAKAVRLIRSEIHYALTGTPIENRLSELWSIFDVLMPGFLYGYEVFRREIETPIVKQQDKEASKRLRRMVTPFILRRLKKDVLKDLPDKIEKVYYAKLDTKQQKLYDGQVAHMKQMLAMQDEQSYKKDKLKVLAELTRIRQICCDPSLIYENYDGESAKRTACMSLIKQAIEGEHRILLFSQFTSMLALLEDDLNAEKIPYYKITGETPKQKRLEMVNAFNEDATPVFLISLKAGGTGLNLTGADVVIHYDPWWNLAVQNQATDRAHRIGQTNIVSVYRLIVRDSIEEKILQMQETKKDLAEEILSGESGGLSALSKEELLELLQV